MGGDTKHPLEVGQLVADALIYHLSPHAARIEVAGSIRRRKELVGDVEIVMIPKTWREKDIFGNEAGPHLDTVEKGIQSYIDSESPDPEKPALVKLNNGERYLKMQETIVNVQIDLFIVRPPAQWGPIISIRTGSAEYSKRLVTGLLKNGMRCEDGQVLDARGRRVDCPEEINFFRAAGMKMIAPWTR